MRYIMTRNNVTTLFLLMDIIILETQDFFFPFFLLGGQSVIHDNGRYTKKILTESCRKRRSLAAEELLDIL